MTKKISLYKTPFICLSALFSTAYAQTVETFLSEYKWTNSTDDTVNSAVFVLILIPVTLIIIYIFQRRKQKRQMEIFANQQFNEKSKEKNLLMFEETLLRNIAWEVAPKMPLEIFKSLIVFENAVDAKIKKTVEKYGENNNTTEDTAHIIANLRRKLGYDKIIPERPIQSTRNMEIGQIISLLDHSNDKNINKAKVSEINELYFSVNLTESDDPSFVEQELKGITTTITFTRVKDAIYNAHLTVKASDKEKGVISFYHTVELERNQARKYARLDMEAGIQCKCKIIEREDENATPAAGETIPETAITDISGGGLAFLSKISLSINDIVMFAFYLQEQKFTIKGKIIAISSQDGKHNVYYKHRVIFCGIKSSDTERIIKFVLRKQQEKLHMK